MSTPYVTVEEYERLLAQKFGVPLEIAKATRGYESGSQHLDPATGKPKASWKGNLGKYQVSQDLLDRDKLDAQNEFHNTYAGIKYLAEGYAEAKKLKNVAEPQKWGAALVYYHGGPGGLKQAYDKGTFRSDAGPGHPGVNSYTYAKNVLHRALKLKNGEDPDVPDIEDTTGPGPAPAPTPTPTPAPQQKQQPQKLPGGDVRVPYEKTVYDYDIAPPKPGVPGQPPAQPASKYDVFNVGVKRGGIYMGLPEQEEEIKSGRAQLTQLSQSLKGVRPPEVLKAERAKAEAQKQQQRRSIFNPMSMMRPPPAPDRRPLAGDVASQVYGGGGLPGATQQKRDILLAQMHGESVRTAETRDQDIARARQAKELQNQIEAERKRPFKAGSIRQQGRGATAITGEPIGIEIQPGPGIDLAKNIDVGLEQGFSQAVLDPMRNLTFDPEQTAAIEKQQQKMGAKAALQSAVDPTLSGEVTRTGVGVGIGIAPQLMLGGVGGAVARGLGVASRIGGVIGAGAAIASQGNWKDDPIGSTVDVLTVPLDFVGARLGRQLLRPGSKALARAGVGMVMSSGVETGQETLSGLHGYMSGQITAEEYRKQILTGALAGLGFGGIEASGAAIEAQGRPQHLFQVHEWTTPQLYNVYNTLQKQQDQTGAQDPQAPIREAAIQLTMAEINEREAQGRRPLWQKIKEGVFPPQPPQPMGPPTPVDRRAVHPSYVPPPTVADDGMITITPDEGGVSPVGKLTEGEVPTLGGLEEEAVAKVEAGVRSLWEKELAHLDEMIAADKQRGADTGPDTFLGKRRAAALAELEKLGVAAAQQPAATQGAWTKGTITDQQAREERDEQGHMVALSKYDLPGFTQAGRSLALDNDVRQMAADFVAAQAGKKITVTNNKGEATTITVKELQKVVPFSKPRGGVAAKDIPATAAGQEQLRKVHVVLRAMFHNKLSPQFGDITSLRQVTPNDWVDLFNDHIAPDSPAWVKLRRVIEGATEGTKLAATKFGWPAHAAGVGRVAGLDALKDIPANYSIWGPIQRSLKGLAPNTNEALAVSQAIGTDPGRADILAEEYANAFIRHAIVSGRTQAYGGEQVDVTQTPALKVNRDVVLQEAIDALNQRAGAAVTPAATTPAATGKKKKGAATTTTTTDDQIVILPDPSKMTDDEITAELQSLGAGTQPHTDFFRSLTQAQQDEQAYRAAQGKGGKGKTKAAKKAAIVVAKPDTKAAATPTSTVTVTPTTPTTPTTTKGKGGRKKGAQQKAVVREEAEEGTITIVDTPAAEPQTPTNISDVIKQAKEQHSAAESRKKAEGKAPEEEGEVEVTPAPKGKKGKKDVGGVTVGAAGTKSREDADAIADQARKILENNPQAKDDIKSRLQDRINKTKGPGKGEPPRAARRKTTSAVPDLGPGVTQRGAITQYGSAQERGILPPPSKPITKAQPQAEVVGGSTSISQQVQAAPEPEAESPEVAEERRLAAIRARQAEEARFQQGAEEYSQLREREPLAPGQPRPQPQPVAAPASLTARTPVRPRDLATDIHLTPEQQAEVDGIRDVRAQIITGAHGATVDERAAIEIELDMLDEMLGTYKAGIVPGTKELAKARYEAQVKARSRVNESLRGQDLNEYNQRDYELHIDYLKDQIKMNRVLLENRTRLREEPRQRQSLQEWQEHWERTETRGLEQELRAQESELADLEGRLAEAQEGRRSLPPPSWNRADRRNAERRVQDVLANRPLRRLEHAEQMAYIQNHPALAPLLETIDGQNELARYGYLHYLDLKSMNQSEQTTALREGEKESAGEHMLMPSERKRRGGRKKSEPFPPFQQWTDRELSDAMGEYEQTRYLSPEDLRERAYHPQLLQHLGASLAGEELDLTRSQREQREEQSRRRQTPMAQAGLTLQQRRDYQDKMRAYGERTAEVEEAEELLEIEEAKEQAAQARGEVYEPGIVIMPEAGPRPKRPEVVLTAKQKEHAVKFQEREEKIEKKLISEEERALYHTAKDPTKLKPKTAEKARQREAIRQAEQSLRQAQQALHTNLVQLQSVKGMLGAYHDQLLASTESGSKAQRTKAKDTLARFRADAAYTLEHFEQLEQDVAERQRDLEIARGERGQTTSVKQVKDIPTTEEIAEFSGEDPREMEAFVDLHRQIDRARGKDPDLDITIEEAGEIRAARKVAGHEVPDFAGDIEERLAGNIKAYEMSRAIDVIAPFLGPELAVAERREATTHRLKNMPLRVVYSNTADFINNWVRGKEPHATAGLNRNQDLPVTPGHVQIIGADLPSGITNQHVVIVADPVVMGGWRGADPDDASGARKMEAHFREPTTDIENEFPELVEKLPQIQAHDQATHQMNLAAAEQSERDRDEMRVAAAKTDATRQLGTPRSATPSRDQQAVADYMHHLALHGDGLTPKDFKLMAETGEVPVHLAHIAMDAVPDGMTMAELKQAFKVSVSDAAKQDLARLAQWRSEDISELRTIRYERELARKDIAMDARAELERQVQGSWLADQARTKFTDELADALMRVVPGPARSSFVGEALTSLVQAAATEKGFAPGAGERAALTGRTLPKLPFPSWQGEGKVTLEHQLDRLVQQVDLAASGMTAEEWKQQVRDVIDAHAMAPLNPQTISEPGANIRSRFLKPRDTQVMFAPRGALSQEAIDFYRNGGTTVRELDPALFSDPAKLNILINDHVFREDLAAARKKVEIQDKKQGAANAKKPNNQLVERAEWEGDDVDLNDPDLKHKLQEVRDNAQFKPIDSLSKMGVEVIQTNHAMSAMITSALGQKYTPDGWTISIERLPAAIDLLNRHGGEKGQAVARHFQSILDSHPDGAGLFGSAVYMVNTGSSMTPEQILGTTLHELQHGFSRETAGRTAIRNGKWIAKDPDYAMLRDAVSAFERVPIDDIDNSLVEAEAPAYVLSDPQGLGYQNADDARAFLKRWTMALVDNVGVEKLNLWPLLETQHGDTLSSVINEVKEEYAKNTTVGGQATTAGAGTNAAAAQTAAVLGGGAAGAQGGGAGGAGPAAAAVGAGLPAGGAAGAAAPAGPAIVPPGAVPALPVGKAAAAAAPGGGGIPGAPVVPPAGGGAKGAIARAVGPSAKGPGFGAQLGTFFSANVMGTTGFVKKNIAGALGMRQLRHMSTNIGSLYDMMRANTRGGNEIRELLPRGGRYGVERLNPDTGKMERQRSYMTTREEIGEWSKEFFKEVQETYQGKPSTFVYGAFKPGGYDTAFPPTGRGGKAGDVYRAYGRFNENLLRVINQAPDRGAFVVAYKDAMMNQYAAHAKADQEGKAWPYTLDQMQARAIAEARHNNFTEDSKTAAFFTGLKHVSNRLIVNKDLGIVGNPDFGLFGSILLNLHFPHIPGNILKNMMVDYNPVVGLATPAWAMAKQLATGKQMENPRYMALRFGRAISGGLVGASVGMFFKMLGIIYRPRNEWEKDRFGFDTEEGLGGYQFNLGALDRLFFQGKILNEMKDVEKWDDMPSAQKQKGDKIASYDFLTPHSFQIALGAAVYEASQKGLFNGDPAAAISVANNAWHTLLDQSLAGGVIESSGGALDVLRGRTGQASAVLARAVAGATVPKQLMAFRQQFLDLERKDTRPETVEKGASGYFKALVQQTAKEVQAKLPYLSDHGIPFFGVPELPAKEGTLGRGALQYTNLPWHWKIMDAILNPGKISVYKGGDVGEALRENQVEPPHPYRQEGEPASITRARTRLTGERFNSAAEPLVQSDYFRKLNKEERQFILGQLRENSGKILDEPVWDPSSQVGKAASALERHRQKKFEGTANKEASYNFLRQMMEASDKRLQQAQGNK